MKSFCEIKSLLSIKIIKLIIALMKIQRNMKHWVSQLNIIKLRLAFPRIDFAGNQIYRIRNKFRLLDTGFFSRRQFTGCLLHFGAIQFWAQIRSESAGYFMRPTGRRSTQSRFKVGTHNVWHNFSFNTI